MLNKNNHTAVKTVPADEQAGFQRFPSPPPGRFSETFCRQLRRTILNTVYFISLYGFPLGGERQKGQIRLRRVTCVWPVGRPHHGCLSTRRTHARTHDKYYDGSFMSRTNGEARVLEGVRNAVRYCGRRSSGGNNTTPSQQTDGFIVVDRVV